MLSQPVVRPAYEYLGGSENLGSKGGYYNYKVHFPDLWKSPSVQTWLRKKQETTKAEYLNRFQRFLVWAKDRIQAGTPDEFLDWANRQKNGQSIQNLIDEYADTLRKSNAHIVTALLRSFLGRNACEKPLPKIDWDSTVSFQEGYKRNEVQSLLQYLPRPIHKLYAMVGKDSGLRANDLLYLRYKHIQRDFEADQKFVAIEFEKERYQRRKAPGRTFIGPNSLDLLRRLFEDGILSKDPEAKLFNFSYRNIAHVIDNAKKTAGVNPKIQPSHGLRKFFENQLDRTGIDFDRKRLMEGHSSGVRNAYTSQDREMGRTDYANAYQYLDLGEASVIPLEVQELQKLDREKTLHIEALKAQLAEKDASTQKRMAELEDKIVDRMMVQMDKAISERIALLQQENRKLEEQLLASKKSRGIEKS